MNVSINYISDVYARLTIDVVKSDYEEKVAKLLSNYAKNVQMPGFRKGKTPMSIIKKKYGVGAKVEVVNEIVSQELVKYIDENKLDILGEPVQSEDFVPYDFTTVEDFKFDFDIAIAPKIDVVLDKNDTVDYYHIEPTAEMVDQQVESLRQSFGKMEDVDAVEENDFVKGLLVELQGDTPKEGGHTNENASFIPKYMKSEDAKSLFVGKNKNTVVVFSPFEAMAGDVAELASFLGVDKDRVGEYSETKFSFEIQSIGRRVPAELNEELYKKVFGENTEVKTEEDLRKEIKREFENLFIESSDTKFYNDLYEILTEKVGKPQFAEDVLKRFLLNKNKDANEQEISDSMEGMLKGLSIDLARRNILRANNAKEITKEDIEAIGKEDVRRQFAQYGMNQVPDDMLMNYLKKTLENKDAVAHYSQMAERKLFVDIAKTLVTIVDKNVNTDEFAKIMNPSK